MPQIVRMKVRDAGRFAGSRQAFLERRSLDLRLVAPATRVPMLPGGGSGFRGDACTGPPSFSSFEGGVPSRPSSAAIVEPRRGGGNGEVCGNTSFRGETAARL
jgi:hypothetical protein